MKVHEKVIDMNVYFPDSIERVLRVLEKRERSAGKARAPIERLGSNRNQNGDGLLTTHNTCVVNWI